MMVSVEQAERQSLAMLWVDDFHNADFLREKISNPLGSL